MSATYLRREWVVIVEHDSGRHYAINGGVRSGDSMVDHRRHTFDEAVELAKELNAVAEVLES